MPRRAVCAENGGTGSRQHLVNQQLLLGFAAIVAVVVAYDSSVSRVQVI